MPLPACFAAFAPRSRSLLAAAALAVGGQADAAVGLQGQIRNLPFSPSAQGRTLVLLTHLTEGRLIGMGQLRDEGLFRVAIPDDFRPPVRPASFCPGVRSSPQEPRTYVAEQLLVFEPSQDRVRVLSQADHPQHPTRRVQWMYSDRPARVQGRCQGLNTRYDLSLRAGWNAVMTVSRSGSFVVRGAEPGLPYWAGEPLSPARRLFPALFGPQAAGGR